MRYVLDLVYLLVLLLFLPWLIYQILTKPKYRRGLLDKLLGRAPVLPASSRPNASTWAVGNAPDS